MQAKTPIQPLRNDRQSKVACQAGDETVSMISESDKTDGHTDVSSLAQKRDGEGSSNNNSDECTYSDRGSTISHEHRMKVYSHGICIDRRGSLMSVGEWDCLTYSKNTANKNQATTTESSDDELFSSDILQHNDEHDEQSHQLYQEAALKNDVDDGMLLDHSTQVINNSEDNIQPQQIEVDPIISNSESDNSNDSDHDTTTDSPDNELPIPFLLKPDDHSSAISRHGNLEEARHLTSEEIEQLLNSNALRCPSEEGSCREREDLCRCLKKMPREVFQDWFDREDLNTRRDVTEDIIDSDKRHKTSALSQENETEKDEINLSYTDSMSEIVL